MTEGTNSLIDKSALEAAWAKAYECEGHSGSLQHIVEMAIGAYEAARHRSAHDTLIEKLKTLLGDPDKSDAQYWKNDGIADCIAIVRDFLYTASISGDSPKPVVDLQGGEKSDERAVPTDCIPGPAEQRIPKPPTPPQPSDAPYTHEVHRYKNEYDRPVGPLSKRPRNPAAPAKPPMDVEAIYAGIVDEHPFILDAIGDSNLRQVVEEAVTAAQRCEIPVKKHEKGTVSIDIRCDGMSVGRMLPFERDDKVVDDALEAAYRILKQRATSAASKGEAV